jgi:hypothetical protein
MQNAVAALGNGKNDGCGRGPVAGGTSTAGNSPPPSTFEFASLGVGGCGAFSSSLASPVDWANSFGVGACEGLDWDMIYGPFPNPNLSVCCSGCCWAFAAAAAAIACNIL